MRLVIGADLVHPVVQRQHVHASDGAVLADHGVGRGDMRVQLHVAGHLDRLDQRRFGAVRLGVRDLDGGPRGVMVETHPAEVAPHPALGSAVALAGVGDDGFEMPHRGHPGVAVRADDHVPLGVGGGERHRHRHALRRAEGEVDVGDAVLAGGDLVARLAGDLGAVRPPSLEQVDHLLVGGGAVHVQTERLGDGDRHVLARDGGGAGDRRALHPTR